MFLKNCWYVAAFSHELDGEQLMTRTLLGARVLLYRTSTGRPVAMLDQCPHRLVPLSLGIRTGDAIRCGYHGMVFGADGRCVRIPGQTEVPDTARVLTYPTIERYGHIWIWMGDASMASEASIPQLSWTEESGWQTIHGHMHFAADYRLLTDNLLDLSHETYLHEGTIGNVDTQSIADYPVKVSVHDGEVVRAAREMLDIDPPPWFAMILGTQDRIDRWQTAIWAAPSINMTDTGASLAGAGRESAFIGRVLHLLTPETENSTHYFWSVSRNYRTEDDALSAAIGQAVERTFLEDKAMLERQQAELDQTGLTVPRVAIRVDDAPLRARRLLSARLRRETESGENVNHPVCLLDAAGPQAAASPFAVG